MEKRQCLEGKSKAVKHTQPMADTSETDESSGQSKKRARIVRRRPLIHRDPLRDVLDFLPVLNLLGLAEVSRLFYRHFREHRGREAVCGAYRKIEFPGEINDVKNLAFFRVSKNWHRIIGRNIPAKYAAPPEDVKGINKIQISINNRSHTCYKRAHGYLEIPKGVHEFLTEGQLLFQEHPFTLNLENITGEDLPVPVWELLESIKNGFPEISIKFERTKSFSVLTRILTLPWALKSNVLVLNFPPPFVPKIMNQEMFQAIVNWLHKKPHDRWEGGGRQVEISAHSCVIGSAGERVMAYFRNLLKQKFLSDSEPRQFKFEMNLDRWVDPFTWDVTRFESAERNECLEWRMVVNDTQWMYTRCLVERKPLGSTMSSSKPTEQWHPDKKQFEFTYSEPENKKTY